MMNGKRPVYLLAGGRPRNSETLVPLLKAVFEESGKTSPNIAYVGAANGDDDSFFKRMAEAFREAGDCTVIQALLASERADVGKAKDILRSADIIFLSGGDVDSGMRVLRESNMVDFLTELFRDGTSFFGISAGSIMLAKEWVRWPDPDDNSSAELFPCLGFAPVICDCHDEQGGWEELKTALRLEKDDTRGYGLVAGSAIRVFSEDRIEALGSPVHQYVRHGRRVNRISDILPVGA